MSVPDSESRRPNSSIAFLGCVLLSQSDLFSNSIRPAMKAQTKDLSSPAPCAGLEKVEGAGLSAKVGSIFLTPFSEGLELNVQNILTNAESLQMQRIPVSDVLEHPDCF